MSFFSVRDLLIGAIGSSMREHWGTWTAVMLVLLWAAMALLGVL